MKRILFVILGILGGLGTLRADLTVVQKIDGAGIATDSTTKVKGDKTRVDAMPGMSMIINADTGDMVSLMHNQKSYMHIPAEMAKMAVSSLTSTSSASNTGKPKLTATGKKETINNYASEEYTCEIAGHKISVWLTTALPNYQAALKEMTAAMSHGPLAATMQVFNIYTNDLPGFPIRTVTEIEPGQVITTTTTSLDTKPIADADFAVPAAYKEMPVPMLTPPAASGTPAAR